MLSFMIDRFHRTTAPLYFNLCGGVRLGYNDRLIIIVLRFGLGIRLVDNDIGDHGAVLAFVGMR